MEKQAIDVGGRYKQKKNRMRMNRTFYVGACAAAVDDQNNMWLSNAEYNGLIKCDLVSGEVKYVRKFERYTLEKTYLHGDAHIVDGKIIFFPFMSTAIVIYDPVRDQEEYVDIPCEKGTSFLPVVKYYKGKYLLVPANLNNGIYVFDLAGRCVKSYEKLNQAIEKYLNYDEEINVSYDDNRMIISFMNKAEYLLIDLQTLENRLYQLPFHEPVDRVFIEGKDIWILLKNSLNIYSIDIQTNEVHRYLPDNIYFTRNSTVFPYSDLVKTDAGEIIVSNYYANSVIRCDSSKQRFANLHIYPDDYYVCGDSIYGPMVSKIIKKNGKLYYVPLRASHLLVYDEKNKAVKATICQSTSN